MRNQVTAAYLPVDKRREFPPGDHGSSIPRTGQDRAVRVSRSIVLPTTLEEAWPVLTSWEAQAKWMRDAGSVRVLTPHREGIGVRVAVRTRVLGIPLFTEPLEVTEWDPPHRHVMAHRGIIRGTGTWTLS